MIRLLVIYAVAAWVVLQVVDVTFPMMGMPDWADRLVLALLGVGLVIGVVLAWTFDMTSAGVVRTAAVDTASPPREEPPREEPHQDPSVEGSSPDTSGAASSGTFSPLAIAVLPFANLSGDPENEYFSDGITEDILTHLSRIKDLQVTSRTSVMGYKGTNKQVPEIARELEVGTVLEGSVRRAGGRVRVTAQLIDAGNDNHLWAETYDRTLEDIFAVQSDIAEMIAAALKAELTSEVAKRIRQHPTDNVAAYDHYLRGREAFRRADAEPAIAELEKAILMDPSFAAAFGALASVYVLSMYWHGASPGEVLPKAKAAAERSLELDSDQALAWMARGLVRYHLDWDWAGAGMAFERALELDPHDADILLWNGHCLACQRRFDEAIAFFRRGVAVDPQHIYKRSWIGFTLMMKGVEVDREEAERHLREAIARDPSHHEAHQFLGWALLCWGRSDEAAERFSICHGLQENPFDIVLRSMALREVDAEFDLSGALDEVRGAVEEIQFHEALAMIAVMEGDLERGLDHLEAGGENRSPIAPWFRNVSAMGAPFADHPRFHAFNHRIFGSET